MLGNPGSLAFLGPGHFGENAGLAVAASAIGPGDDWRLN